MWEPLETLLNSQVAVSQTLTRNWASYLRAALVPGLAAVGVLLWMGEAYWASATFTAGQIAIVACSLVLVLLLSSLAIGRMVRIALRSDPAPGGVRALGANRADLRVLAVSAGLIGLMGLAVILQVAAARIVAVSYFTPGSDAIARPVLAFADSGILLALYYLLGRLALFLPAAATAARFHPAVVWRASEGHGAILFIVIFGVPWAVAVVLAGPLLWWIGAIPWPELSDFARTQSLGLALNQRLYIVAPVLLFVLMGVWALIAAGLGAAWEALKERGALDALEVAV